MKKLIFASLFLILGIFVVSAQNLPSITIVNNTGYPLVAVALSPEEFDNWGDGDILGDVILENGQSFTYRLPYPLNKYNVYDFIAIDEDEDAYYKWGVTVTNNARIVFVFDDIED